MNKEAQKSNFVGTQDDALVFVGRVFARVQLFICSSMRFYAGFVLFVILLCVGLIPLIALFTTFEEWNPLQFLIGFLPEQLSWDGADLFWIYGVLGAVLGWVDLYRMRNVQNVSVFYQKRLIATLVVMMLVFLITAVVILFLPLAHGVSLGTMYGFLVLLLVGALICYALLCLAEIGRSNAQKKIGLLKKPTDN